MKRPNLSTSVFLAVSAVVSFATVAYADDGSGSSTSEICPTMYADFERRQLKEFSVEAPFDIEQGAKHVPVLTISEDGATGTVVVGNGNEVGGEWHPMVASEDPEMVHFVTHIMVKDQDGKIVALEAMDPTVAAPATMTFAVPAGVTALTPYEWCNKHGFHVGDTIEVSGGQGNSSCGLSHFKEGAWTSVHADFLRLQKSVFQSDAAFVEADGVKHTPYITLNDDGTSASVFVGKTGVAVHPMTGSLDGEFSDDGPHWITEIYVTDQSGAIVTMVSLDTAGVDVATLDFPVPEGAESLTAYAWCNLHGLWAGPAVAVGDSDSDASVMDNASVSPSFSAGALVGASLLMVLNIL
mmetsp:Transcript_16485/g.28268  ORF Transcript_16485/g.28268 Transcript_16485/m.28268 type:complete len:353 (-) Transcript_16485:178-1236(-)